MHHRKRNKPLPNPLNRHLEDYRSAATDPIPSQELAGSIVGGSCRSGSQLANGPSGANR